MTVNDLLANIAVATSQAANLDSQGLHLDAAITLEAAIQEVGRQPAKGGEAEEELLALAAAVQAASRECGRQERRAALLQSYLSL